MSDLFQHLNEFGLNNKNTVHRVLKKFSPRRLECFLESYANATLKAEYHANPIGSTDVYPDSEAGIIPHDLIRQLGMYANCFYLHDPLVDQFHQFKTLDANFLEVIRHPKMRDRVNGFKNGLAKEIVTLLKLKPFADSSFIRFLPTTLYTHVDPTAIFSSMFYGPDGQLDHDKLPPLPPAVIEFMQTKMRVLPAEFSGDAVIMRLEGELKPSNVIGIEIEGDNCPMMYCLSDVRLHSDEAKRKANVLEMHFDHTGRTKPSPERFEKWVAGERERCLRSRLRQLEHDMTTAARANASFITTRPASIELAKLNLSPAPQENPVLNTLLQLPLPYLDKVSLADVARARKNEAAFEEFRVALRDALKEANAINDDNERNQRIIEIAQDIIHAPLARIDERMKSLNTKVAVQATVLVGTFVASLVTAGATLAGAALATAVGAAATTLTGAAGVAYRPNKDEQDNIRRLPSYFYWELTKNARRSK